MARFSSNENFPIQTVRELRQLHHDVLTSQDAGNANRSVSDEEVLQYAALERRALLTQEPSPFFAAAPTESGGSRRHCPLHLMTRTSIGWRVGYMMKWPAGTFSTGCCSVSTARTIDPAQSPSVIDTVLEIGAILRASTGVSRSFNP